MTDSLRLFSTEAEYNSVKDSLEYPTVSYVEETDNVYYISNIQPNYFYIEALADDMTVMLSHKTTEDTEGAPTNDLEYSTDLSTWNMLSMNTASPAINTGEKIYLRGNAVPYYNEEESIMAGIGQFTISQSCNIGGNIMSLLFNDDFEDKTDLTGYDAVFAYLFLQQPIVNASELILPATTLSMGCYGAMFVGCTQLEIAPALPATTLAISCYINMFYECTSLVTAPELPATTLADSCYNAMFVNCTQLEIAPALPATTLTDFCYANMFSGCTSLTTAPELPATTLSNSCYMYMFYGCSNLNYIKMLSTDISANSGLIGWVNGVSATGTFVKNPALSEETIGQGINGIPEGWTVVDAE